MKILTITVTALLFGTTAISFAQTPNQPPRQQGYSAQPNMMDPYQPNARRAPMIIERETTGMGLREPEVEFLFGPGVRDPQRNDLTVSPFGPMNNID